MQTEHIVAVLIAERDRLSRAIDALQDPAKRRGRPPGSGRTNVALSAPETRARKKRRISPAGRKAMAAAARRRWAAIKAGKAKSPFAKSARKKS
jgi:hypothetical protein